MIRIRALSCVAAVASLLIVLPEPAAAQAGPVTNLTQDELETFAEAYVEVIGIAEEVEALLAGVQDPQQAQAIQAEGQQQMAAVLEEHDLTAERYRNIGDAINQDDELRGRFFAIVDEILQQGGAL